MRNFLSNPFADLGSVTLPTVEPGRQDSGNDERRLSTVSMEDQLDWHETFLFGPSHEPQRRRRASSFGDVSEYTQIQPPAIQSPASDEAPARPQATPFRYRTPSVVDARLQGLGRTRARHGSVTHDQRSSIISARRSSIYDRRGSGASNRRPSIASDGRGRQPSVAWARQSSVIDNQLANMTWSQAERLMSLDDQFYQDAGDSGRSASLLAIKMKKLDHADLPVKGVEPGPPPVVDPEKIEEAYPQIADPTDPAKVLGRSNLRVQKTLFMIFILSINLACLLGAILGGGPAGTFVFVFILFTKSKDFCSVILAIVYMPLKAIYHYFRPPQPVTGKWILTLIPAYSESEETIIRAIRSLRDNDATPHEQLMVVMLDGKPRDVKLHLKLMKSFRRPYVTFKWKRGEFLIDAGFLDEIPVIVFEKVKNAGKKDSLIMAFDLFGELRANAPLYTKLLRQDIWNKVLPMLTANKSIPFEKFDMIFCTDADSTIYKGALARLANALLRDTKAIAACGSVLVETLPGQHWSIFNLYQQFQYSFGQYVRRRAESIWGKVTCLPGCITMIRVREELKGAVTRYAEPVTKTPVFYHQVQYLGTDRRLTFSMLSQSKNLHTLFVPNAVSLTEAPQTLRHYLSQRRRWGANSYFNDWFYLFGENMIPITRLEATIEIVRLSLVYYRMANTVMFFYGLGTKSFSAMQLVPLLVVSQLPTAWYFLNVIFVAELRRRAPKIMLGFCINHLIGPFMSMTIFFNVLRNLGSQVWGMTGGSNAAAVAPISTSTNTTIGLVPLPSTQKDGDRTSSTHSAITLGTEKIKLGSVAELDEAGDSIESLASDLADTEEIKPSSLFSPPVFNSSFGFESKDSLQNPFRDSVSSNPFRDSFSSKFSEASKTDGFGTSQASLNSAMDRRRSSVQGPLDLAGRPSNAHIPTVQEEDEEDDQKSMPASSSPQTMFNTPDFTEGSRPITSQRFKSGRRRSSVGLGPSELRRKTSLANVESVLNQKPNPALESQPQPHAPVDSLRFEGFSTPQFSPAIPRGRRKNSIHLTPLDMRHQRLASAESIGTLKEDDNPEEIALSSTISSPTKTRVHRSRRGQPALTPRTPISPAKSDVKLSSMSEDESETPVVAEALPQRIVESAIPARRMSMSTSIEVAESVALSPVTTRSTSIASPVVLRRVSMWSKSDPHDETTIEASGGQSSPLENDA